MAGEGQRIKIEEKAFRFAKGVVELAMSLPQNETRFVLGKQLMRSGTSIGANIEEAQGGISKSEFIHSMNIAKKEARETIYWLRLLAEFDYVNKEKVNKLIGECEELIRMLTSIVKTAQERR
ncbi:MAG: four helix bundle protein [Candidatus Omnitrophica bacterium]|nr:four helix bundle protein [Candidatus Omnitrophota bacterium]